MAVLAGIFGGIICGAAFLFLLALLSFVPHFGWVDHIATPVFVIASLTFGPLIGLKYDKLAA